MWSFWYKTVLGLAAASAASVLLWRKLKEKAFLWLAGIAGLLAYHIGLRVAASLGWNAVLHNKADYQRPWFQVKPWEKQLYKKLKVRRWKNKMPTHDPESFNVKTHSWDDIAQTTCQSELVHETNAVLSLLPILLVSAGGLRWLAAAFGFLGLLADSVFIIMQRFNRGRIVAMIAHKKAKQGAR